MQEKIAEAWRLFDIGEYAASEKIYEACLKEINENEYDTYASILMGIIYTQSFQKKYDEARSFAKELVELAPNEEELHIALHQAGMVERMAGNYDEAMNLFHQEEELIQRVFPEDHLRVATNLYEQAYVSMKSGDLEVSEHIMRLSLEHAKDADDAMCMGCAYRGLGEIMNLHGERDSANSFFEQAIEAFKLSGDMIAVKEVEDMRK